MRRGAAIGAVALWLVLAGGAATASEPTDAGADSTVAPTATDAIPEAASTREAPLQTAPTPAATPILSDPTQVATAQEERNRALWPLAYVDRPQTMFEGMEVFSLAGGDDFGGPPGYWRFLAGIAYAKAVTNRVELGLGFPRLYCTGAGPGTCSSSLEPEIRLRVAALRRATVKLSLGAQLLDFSYSAEAWARLKLVVPHRFSFEVEPLVLMGIRAKPIEAWWDPAVVQDGNQSRVFLTFDANLQLTPHVLVWVDAIPFLPTARFETPNDAALELAAGLGVAITKAFEMSVSCYSLDTRSARRWEYVPDVRGCALSLLARRFGRAPAGPGVVPVPRSLY